MEICSNKEGGEVEYPVTMPARDVAAQLGTNHSTVLEYARRADDPLPLRYIKGKRNGGFVITADFVEWLERNTCAYSERRDHAAPK